jgi:hypothetical protein
VGYRFAPRLLTPHKEPATPAEVAYNNLHKTERAIDERSFEQLKRRFPVLQHPIRVLVGTHKIPSVIICLVLYCITLLICQQVIMKLKIYFRKTMILINANHFFCLFLLQINGRKMNGAISSF